MSKKELPTGKARRGATVLGYALVRLDEAKTKSRSDDGDGTRAFAGSGALPIVFAETTLYGSIRRSVQWTDPDLDLRFLPEEDFVIRTQATRVTIWSSGKVTNRAGLKMICRLNGSLRKQDWIPLAVWSRSFTGPQPAASLGEIYDLACGDKQGLAVLAAILSGRGTLPPVSGDRLLLSGVQLAHSAIESKGGVDQAYICATVRSLPGARLTFSYTFEDGTSPFTSLNVTAGTSGKVNARTNVPVVSTPLRLTVDISAAKGGKSDSQQRQLTITPTSVSLTCKF